MSIFGLFISFKAKRGKRDAVAAILLESSSVMSRNPECKLHVVAEDQHSEDIVWVTEFWTSKSAHDVAVNSPGVRKLTSSVLEVAEREGRVVTMNVIGEFEPSRSGREQ
jgi:quinol monooxygenase YgiN